MWEGNLEDELMEAQIKICLNLFRLIGIWMTLLTIGWKIVIQLAHFSSSHFPLVTFPSIPPFLACPFILLPPPGAVVSASS